MSSTSGVDTSRMIESSYAITLCMSIGLIVSTSFSTMVCMISFTNTSHLPSSRIIVSFFCVWYWRDNLSPFLMCSLLRQYLSFRTMISSHPHGLSTMFTLIKSKLLVLVDRWCRLQSVLPPLLYLSWCRVRRTHLVLL